MKSLLSDNMEVTLAQRKFVYLGFLLGVGLIALAIASDLAANSLSFSSTSITKVYQRNITHWIILTSPFFLAGVFFVMARMIKQRERIIARQLSEEKTQFSILEEFISQLESENFTTAISDEFRNTRLSAQLEKFKQKLITEKRNEEKRSWENQGIANFSELLRKQRDAESLSVDVLRYVIKYLNANQGSVFLLNDQQESLVLSACYAYDKKKFVSGSIPVGEGLVGQCFLEKATILLLQVPADYIKITSGLGLATPTCVVLTPLKTKDKVVGVIELALFNRLEDYQIKFLERCAEAFASVVDSVSMNENVKNLLEQSQQQMEELRSQEEEMRQNLEELQAIQEQMARQLEENTRMKNALEARESVLSQTTILSEADLHGTITFVNSKFQEVSGFSAEELIGKGHNVVRHPDMPKELFRQMWTTIKSGKTFRGIVKNRKKNGGEYWVDATIVPIFQNGKIVKYIGARYHIKDTAMAERLFEQQLDTMDLSVKMLTAS